MAAFHGSGVLRAHPRGGEVRPQPQLHLLKAEKERRATGRTAASALRAGGGITFLRPFNRFVCFTSSEGRGQRKGFTSASSPGSLR